MLPQTIIWHAMLMRGGIKAERTQTANRILRTRQVLAPSERRAPARHEAMKMAATRRAGGRRSNFAHRGAGVLTRSARLLRITEISCALFVTWPLRLGQPRSGTALRFFHSTGPVARIHWLPYERAEPIPTWPHNVKIQSPVIPQIRASTNKPLKPKRNP